MQREEVDDRLRSFGFSEHTTVFLSEAFRSWERVEHVFLGKYRIRTTVEAQPGLNGMWISGVRVTDDGDGVFETYVDIDLAASNMEDALSSALLVARRMRRDIGRLKKRHGRVTQKMLREYDLDIESRSVPVVRARAWSSGREMKTEEVNGSNRQNLG